MASNEPTPIFKLNSTIILPSLAEANKYMYVHEIDGGWGLPQGGVNLCHER